MQNKLILRSLVLASLTSVASANVLVDFEDKSLAPGSFYNGGPVTNTAGWTSNAVQFGNSYNSSFGGFWNGFSYSNINNPTTPGFSNQYAAFAGPAFSGSIYAVGYSGANDFVNLPVGETPASVRVTNTAYAAFDMLAGSGFSKKFGGVTGNDPDFLDVTFTGYAQANATGSTTGSVTFRLADYTFADNVQDYVVNTWQLLDLTPLGSAASIGLGWASSDVGAFGINTPTYVAIDDLRLVPEPAALSLVAIAGAFALARRSRRPGV